MRRDNVRILVAVLTSHFQDFQFARVKSWPSDARIQPDHVIYVVWLVRIRSRRALQLRALSPRQQDDGRPLWIVANEQGFKLVIKIGLNFIRSVSHKTLEFPRNAFSGLDAILDALLRSLRDASHNCFEDSEKIYCMDRARRKRAYC